MTKWIPIFKAGTHKDSKGVERSYSVDDLDGMVTLYNDQPEETRRKAPHVYGHPSTNAPAHGWVGALKRIGSTLYASCEEMSNDFVESVRGGAYKFRSASFYPNGLLRHVGWLGAVQPAVAGLGEVQFSDDDGAITFEDFMDDWEASWRFTRLADLFQRVREWIISKDGIDEANNIIPAWDIEGLRPPPPSNNNFHQQHHEDQDMELKEQLESLTRDFSELKAERDQLKLTADNQTAQISGQEQQIASLSAQVTALQQHNVKADIENFCDGLISEGRMLPAEREYFVEDLTAKALASSDFAEGTSPLDKAKAMLSARTPHRLFGEHATRERAAQGGAAGLHDFAEHGFSVNDEAAALDTRVQEIMKEKGITNYAEALDLAAKEL